MRYYSVSLSTESKIIGKKYPQAIPVSGANYNDPSSLLNLSDDCPMTKTSTKYELEKTAKCTDILSIGFTKYFAIREKVKESISKFQIGETSFIPVEIYEPSNSSWFVIYFPFTDQTVGLLNYDETIFYITDGLGIENLGEFILGETTPDKRKKWREKYKTTEDGQEIRIKKIVIKKEFESLDLLYLSPFYDRVIVSEKIKKSFENNAYLGLNFSEIEITIQ